MNQVWDLLMAEREQGVTAVYSALVYYLDTYCFECLIRMFFFYFCIWTCSAQLRMFHIERHSRNMLIIIIIIVIMIVFKIDLKVENISCEALSRVAGFEICAPVAVACGEYLLLMSYITPCHTPHVDLRWKMCVACSALFGYILKVGWLLACLINVSATW